MAFQVRFPHSAAEYRGQVRGLLSGICTSSTRRPAASSSAKVVSACWMSAVLPILTASTNGAEEPAPFAHPLQNSAKLFRASVEAPACAHGDKITIFPKRATAALGRRWERPTETVFHRRPRVGAGGTTSALFSYPARSPATGSCGDGARLHRQGGVPDRHDQGTA